MHDPRSSLLGQHSLRKTIEDSVILIVDDIDFNRVLIQEIYTNHHFKHIITADNGLEAIKETLEHNPDLVILDLLMPEMDGFEYIETIREMPAFKDLPILVQSALNKSEERSRAFNYGATDFVMKPIDADELIARSFVLLERQKLLKDLQVYQQRTQTELQDARYMQQSILPTPDTIQEIKDSYNVDVYSFFEPSSELGGDFWGIQPLSSNEIAIFNTDFSGHGITAALNTFRLHTLMSSTAHQEKDPGKLLMKLNTRLNELLPIEQFATMFYGVINKDKGTLTYASAASTSPIFHKKGEAKPSIISGRGFPLGIASDSTFKTEVISFTKGDTIMLYSDALIETCSPTNQIIDENTLSEFMLKHVDETGCCNVKTCFSSVMEYFFTHFYSQINDDLTISMYQQL